MRLQIYEKCGSVERTRASCCCLVFSLIFSVSALVLFVTDCQIYLCAKNGHARASASNRTAAAKTKNLNDFGPTTSLTAAKLKLFVRVNLCAFGNRW